jgi:peptidoglycan hydrolase CwlO-like protein
MSGTVTILIIYREQWYQDLIAEKDHILHDLQIQLGKKEEEIQYLIRQLDYIQTKYRQKKMQISVLKNGHRSEDSSINYPSKPERDGDSRYDANNCTVHDYGTADNRPG